ncbi:MAG: hypothetical protein ACR2JX_04670 [Mycobacteriales bacterium]
MAASPPVTAGTSSEDALADWGVVSGWTPVPSVAGVGRLTGVANGKDVGQNLGAAAELEIGVTAAVRATSESFPSGTAP